MNVANQFLKEKKRMNPVSNDFSGINWFCRDAAFFVLVLEMCEKAIHFTAFFSKNEDDTVASHSSQSCQKREENIFIPKIEDLRLPELP